MGTQGVILGYSIGSLAFSYPFFISISKYGISICNIKKILSKMLHAYSFEISRISSMFMDKIFIGPIFGVIILGYYHLSVQILFFLSMIPLVFYYFNLAEESGKKTASSLKKVIILFSAIITIIYIISAPLVLPYLFPKFEESIIPSLILSLGIVPLAISYNAQSTLLARKKGKHVLIASTIFVLLQLILFYFLGNIFDVQGLSLALLISLIVQALYYTAIRRRIKEYDLFK